MNTPSCERTDCGCDCVIRWLCGCIVVVGTGGFHCESCSTKPPNASHCGQKGPPRDHKPRPIPMYVVDDNGVVGLVKALTVEVLSEKGTTMTGNVTEIPWPKIVGTGHDRARLVQAGAAIREALAEEGRK